MGRVSNTVDSITDDKGKFTIDKLCEGQVQVNVNVRRWSDRFVRECKR